jgi:hypothetical protein
MWSRNPDIGPGDNNIYDTSWSAVADVAAMELGLRQPVPTGDIILNLEPRILSSKIRRADGKPKPSFVNQDRKSNRNYSTSNASCSSDHLFWLIGFSYQVNLKLLAVRCEAVTPFSVTASFAS